MSSNDIILREIFTPTQAAEYLQVNRETVYRYIREGKLQASALGRTYRIPKRNIDLFLLSLQTHRGVALRTYSDEEIADFQEEDELTGEAQQFVERVRSSFAENPVRNG